MPCLLMLQDKDGKDEEKIDPEEDPNAVIEK